MRSLIKQGCQITRNSQCRRLVTQSLTFAMLTFSGLAGQYTYAQDADTMVAKVNKARYPIVIDGNPGDLAWQQGAWHPLNHLILGEPPTAEDFSGQFKLLWNEQYLYLLAKITDDVLVDRYANPLLKYWDDDCLEIFIDEDNSGGEHQFNFNAFAYHVALDNQAVDIGPNLSNGEINFVLLNQHISSQWRRSMEQGNPIYWEVAIEIHDDSFVLPASADNQGSRVSLASGKKMGFMLAYCDNDGSEEREHFMGSTEIKPVNGDKNLGYKTADVFSEIQLIKPQ